jgi:hypothetical protein
VWELSWFACEPAAAAAAARDAEQAEEEVARLPARLEAVQSPEATEAQFAEILR